MNYLQDIKDDWVLNKMNICLKGEPEDDIKTLLFWIKSNYFTIMQQDRDIRKYKEVIADFAEEYNYEVYLAFNDKDNLYVGSGLAGRHKHCTSGRSHVVQLNKEILAGNKVETVIVADGLTKRNSLEIEKLNILLFKPLYNKKISKNIDSKIVSAFMNIVEESRKGSSASTNN